MLGTVTVIGSAIEVAETLTKLDTNGVRKIYLAGNELLAPAHLPWRCHTELIEAPMGLFGADAEIESYMESGCPDAVLWLRKSIRDSAVIYISSNSDLLTRMVQFIAAQEKRPVQGLDEVRAGGRMLRMAA